MRYSQRACRGIYGRATVNQFDQGVDHPVGTRVGDHVAAEHDAAGTGFERVGGHLDGVARVVFRGAAEYEDGDVTGLDDLAIRLDKADVVDLDEVGARLGAGTGGFGN